MTHRLAPAAPKTQKETGGTDASAGACELRQRVARPQLPRHRRDHAAPRLGHSIHQMLCALIGIRA